MAPTLIISTHHLIISIQNDETWLFGEIFGVSVDTISLFNFLHVILNRPEGVMYHEACRSCFRNIQALGIYDARMRFLEEIHAVGNINPYSIIPEADIELLFYLVVNLDNDNAAALICIYRRDLTYGQARIMLNTDLRASETHEEMREKCRQILTPRFP